MKTNELTQMIEISEQSTQTRPNTLIAKVVKDVSLSNHRFEPNCLVLVKRRETVSRDGEVSVVFRYIEVPGLFKTESYKAVRLLLSACLSDFKTKNGFNEKYKECEVAAGEVLESGITAKSSILPFLTTDTIYRTNEQGAISHALISELPLKNTALNVKEKHLIVGLSGDKLRTALHHQTLAIVEQTTYVRTLTMNLETVLNLSTDNKGEKNEVTAAVKVAAPKVAKKAAVKVAV